MPTDQITFCAKHSIDDVCKKYNCSLNGLSEKQADKNRQHYGSNRMVKPKRNSICSRIARAFITPFSLVLFTLAVISLISNHYFNGSVHQNITNVIVMIGMLFISGTIRLIQELKSKKSADQLSDFIHGRVKVLRNNLWTECEAEDLTVGDRIALTAGKTVPADIRLIHSHNCYVSQSVLTGESRIDEKSANQSIGNNENIFQYSNIILKGTTIVSGSCDGLVISVGSNAMYDGVPVTKKKNRFDEGTNAIIRVLIRFMLLLIPIVFFVSGLTKHNWLSAFGFALSVGIGLTPELLPMVVTACLAKGSSNMEQKETIVKNTNAMQNFGSMDILCVDKTGTLTNDHLILEYYMDLLGNEDQSVFDASYLSSFYSSGIKNHLDQSILKAGSFQNFTTHCKTLRDAYQKIDAISFDSDRKISSVLLRNKEQMIMIAKGEVNEIAKRCTRYYYRDQVYEIKELASLHEIVDEMLSDGMKVIAVAGKSCNCDHYDLDDENDLILLGYLVFFDAPKPSAFSAIEKLRELNVTTKVLTGDNAEIAKSICKRIGIEDEQIVTGSMLESSDSDSIRHLAEKHQIFAQLSPGQKKQLVTIMQKNGHTVGFLGDGINDLPAVCSADVGISVENAAPALKEAADVILLKKDLNILENGILEGRRAFVNMSKYMKITASSNLGNMIAVVIASVFLPFFPMTGVQILLLNLLYDLLCLILPWDHVDSDFYTKPLEWTGKYLARFMIFFGPLSSVFDVITFGFLYFFLCPFICGAPFHLLTPVLQSQFISLFQTGWFLESMWTQVLILQLLRTNKFLFLQSKPSLPVMVITLSGTIIFTVLAITPAGSIIGMHPLPFWYFLFLLIVVVSYMFVVTAAKKRYLKRYDTLI